MSQRDSERIARQWKREIETELRSEAERRTGQGPWRALPWAGLWLLWLALLVLLLSQMRSLH